MRIQDPFKIWAVAAFCILSAPALLVYEDPHHIYGQWIPVKSPTGRELASKDERDCSKVESWRWVCHQVPDQELACSKDKLQSYNRCQSL